MICRKCLHTFKRDEKVALTGKRRARFRSSVHANPRICAANLKPYKRKETIVATISNHDRRNQVARKKSQRNLYRRNSR